MLLQAEMVKLQSFNDERAKITETLALNFENMADYHDLKP